MRLLGGRGADQRRRTVSSTHLEKVQRIIYKSGEEFINLHNTSPSTQTNAVMEFILHTDSTVPLFIDQPEDNIDNEARYKMCIRDRLQS